MSENHALELVHSSNVKGIDAKRQAIREERKRRLMNKGVSEQRAEEMILNQDHDNLSDDKKIQRLETLFVQTFQGLQRDIIALRHNDGVIADAMEINLKAMSKCLEKAGISKEQQGEIIKEVESELREEQKRKMEAQAMAEKMASDQAEKARMEQLSKEESKMTSAEAEGSEIPSEASVFGG